MSEFINESQLFQGQKPKVVTTVDKSVKFALSKIFFLEGVVVLIATLLISLANVQLGVENGIKPVSTMIRSILLWVSSYLMYIVYLSWGSQKGKETLEYKQAIENYTKEKEKILRQDYTKLAKYCIYYIKDELKNSRITQLSEIGMSYEHYEKHYLGKSNREISLLNLPDEVKSVIMRANAIKPTTLSPAMLMTSDVINSRNLLSTDTETLIKKDKFWKIVTSAMFSLVIGSVLIDVSFANGWAILITCVLNMLPLVLNIFMGAYQGFKAYSVNEVTNLNGKATHFVNCEKFVPQEQLEFENESKQDIKDKSQENL